MAIDFGRMAKGIATGYLGAKIANTEANDQMNANIIEQAGLNFYEDTLPKFQTEEKNRKVNYGKVSARYGKNVAEYLGQNKFITGDKTNFDDVVEMLGANSGLNETKLNAYLESSSSSYEERATSRLDAIQEREKTITGLTTGSSKIGSMTANLMIPESTPKSEQTITTPAVEGSQVGPVVTEDIPEKTETAKLPSYAEIFGDTSASETNFFNLDPDLKEKLQGQSDQQYKTIFTDKVTGMAEHPKEYEEAYDNLPDSEKNKQTLQQYSYNRYFRERYLPEFGLTYGNVSSKVSEPRDIQEARYLINDYKSNNQEDKIGEVRKRLTEAGYDLTKYSL